MRAISKRGVDSEKSVHQKTFELMDNIYKNCLENLLKKTPRLKFSCRTMALLEIYD